MTQLKFESGEHFALLSLIPFPIFVIFYRSKEIFSWSKMFFIFQLSLAFVVSTQYQKKNSTELGILVKRKMYSFEKAVLWTKKFEGQKNLISI